jgi:TolB-like protein/Tfp pilus assembly protein PilF
MLERGPTKRPRDGAEVLAALEGIEKALPAGSAPVKVTRRRASLADLFAELKRRRVFRVMAAYGIFSFAVLQVIEPVLHAFHLADWFLTATVVALGVGFPVAVILSWVFDVTSEGVKRTPTVKGAVTLSRARLVTLLAGVALLAALPVAGWYTWKRGREAAANPPAAGTASIAVLPFADLSPNHDQDYFSDGVAEEILNALSRVEGLKVPGRASSFWFKGKNAEASEIASKLGVAHLLQGSVRRSGKMLRVTAEVSRVAGGERLWSQTFERELTDVFAVQDEIAGAVVVALRGKLLLGAATAMPPPAQRTSPETYNEYLLGQRFYRSFSEAGFRRAVTAYEKALQLDPSYAPAWAALGVPMFYLARRDATIAEARARAERALAAAEKALALSPDLCDGLSTRGILRYIVRWDWAGALADLERGLKLCPNDPDVWRRYSKLVVNLGRPDEANAAAEKAVALDPLGHSTIHLGWARFETGRFEEARAAFERALELTPDSPTPAEGLADSLLILGRVGEALDRYRRPPCKPEDEAGSIARALYSLGRIAEAESLLKQLEAEAEPDAPEIAKTYAWMGRRDQAFAWLDRAVALRDLGLAEEYTVGPFMRALHGDPRWSAFLRKMNLKPPGEAGGWANPTQQNPSIAVLPFADMSPGHDQEYFADGVAEEILNALAHVEGLRVPGRTSSFWFKGKNAKLSEIGRELSVNHVLEGSVRRSGKRLRVTAQVVNVADGGHLWSETFERPEGDVFAVQDEVARAVVAALKVKLMRPPTATRRAGQTINPEAYAQYLLGQHLNGLGTPDGYRQARDAYQRAIELDPTYAPPHARLGAVLRDVAYSGGRQPGGFRSMRERGPVESERAIQLGPELPEGYFTRSFFRLAFQLDFTGATADAERAIALDPTSTNGYRRRAQLLAARGKLDEAIAQMRRPTENDPLAVLNWNWLADFQIASGRLEDAEASLKRAFELAPENDDARSHLATLRLLQGRPADALALAGRLVQGRHAFEAMAHHALGHAGDSQLSLEALRREAGGTDQISLAEVYAWLGMPDRAFEALDHLGEEEYWDLRFRPLLGKLRGDPRWKALLARLHLSVD